MKRNLYLLFALLLAGTLNMSAQQMVVVAGESSNTHWEYPYDDAKITFSDGQMLFHLKGKVTNTYNIKDIERIYFFVYDAVGSALAESVCDEAEKMIKKNLKCRPRFSPGYGDFPLSVQRDVLSLVNAERLVGITLTDTNLMLPQKSITAILGIREDVCS